MNANNILQQGTELKYHVSIVREGFDMETDDFSVTLSWGIPQQSLTINKSDMQMGGDSQWLMSFSTANMLGAITAACSVRNVDSDEEDGVLTEVDRQVIAFIVNTPNPQLLVLPSDSESAQVTYERVTTPGSVSMYKYLCDANHLRLRTADGKYMAVLNEDYE